MSSVDDQTDSVQASQSFRPAQPSTSSSVFCDPVFLMVNSLETGGTERQFCELARAFRRARVPVRLGCLQRKGAFVDGLGELAEYPLGGSLYRWKSIRSRLRLARDLRKFGIKV